LRICQERRISASDLASQSIIDILQQANFIFRHQGFPSIDAEDNIYQLCLLLYQGNDYVCVMCPETGALVSILGVLDVIYLLTQLAKTNETLFSMTLQTMQIGTWDQDVVTSPLRASLSELLTALESRDISSAPVLDDHLRLVGLYHRSDVSFAMKATDCEAALSNLRTFTVEDSLLLREQLLQSGDIMSNTQGLVTCQATDNLISILNAMLIGRSNRVVVLNEKQQCRGVVGFKDILKYLLEFNNNNNNNINDNNNNNDHNNSNNHSLR
jgi:CBS domain-containing protein